MFRDRMEDSAAMLGAILGTLLIVAIAPLIFMWAWNQLFGTFLTIEYTFWNWLAALVLTGSATYRKIK
jgi:hypothetical protein